MMSKLELILIQLTVIIVVSIITSSIEKCSFYKYCKKAEIKKL